MLKKLTLYCALLFSCSLLQAQDIPEKSSALVTDYTNTLTNQQKASLERKLVDFDDSTSTQIAVVIIKSTGGYDINEYAALLGRKWGIGQKDKNNGVVLLVAMADRKLSIQTGYGSEGMLPDAVTHDIIYNDIQPRFKAGDYYGGIDAGTDDIIKYSKGEYKPDPNKQGKKSKHNDGGPAGFIIIIIVIILIAIFRNRGGGGGHIIGRRGGASPFWWFLAGSMLGNSSRGDSDWGGFSGGGGGSSGGGGFGGFGGGSFGGGGSSGSW